MIPWSVQMTDITINDLEILAWMRRTVADMPDDWTCHQVCDSLARRSTIIPLGPALSRLPLSQVRGWFSRKGWDHSWLVLKNRPILYDPYPWCCGSGPILVYTGGILNPWRDLYIKRTD